MRWVQTPSPNIDDSERGHEPITGDVGTTEARNLATNQRSYYRVEEGVAGKRLKNAWKDRAVHIAQTPLIEKEFDNTGYS